MGQLIPLIISVGEILQDFKALFLVWLNGDGREEGEQDARQARISRDVSTSSSSEIVGSGGDDAREEVDVEASRERNVYAVCEY